MISHASTLTDGRVHVPQEYAGRLTDDPAYDWDHSPVDPALIPVADLNPETAQKFREAVGEQTMTLDALAQAVPAVAELRQAA